MKNIFSLFILAMVLFACNSTQQVDTIYINAQIIDPLDTNKNNAFAVKDGKFVAVGLKEEILKNYSSNEIIDLKDQFVLPGLIDAHCHFYNYALLLETVNLYGVSSEEELVKKVKEFSEQNPQLNWIVGRGWDQNLFPGKKFPTNEALNKLFPNTPVVLTRVDGHALIANNKALEIGGINVSTKISGGSIILNGNKPSGILVDNAMDLVTIHIPEPSREKKEELLLKAQEQCFKVGLTSVQDAGLSYQTILFIDSLQKVGKLKMRMYVMMESKKETMDYFAQRGKIKTDYLNVQSVKVYGDGALGSRGACLLSPYSDAPKESGFFLNTLAFFDSVANYCVKNGFQMNTHCIGDSTNRSILKMYASKLEKGNNARWRIEHCQIVNSADLPLFGMYGVLPSVQFTHATSDMYWAEERLGNKRIKDAYRFRELLEQAGHIPNGSDFPVEGIHPLMGFYAGVARKDLKGFPENGFNAENALSRIAALRAMTSDAAFAAFEENEKGAIRSGYFADFIVMKENILTMPIEKVPLAEIVATYSSGIKN